MQKIKETAEMDPQYRGQVSNMAYIAYVEKITAFFSATMYFG